MSDSKRELAFRLADDLAAETADLLPPLARWATSCSLLSTGGYRPFHCGGRLSRKAAGPSWASSLR